MAKLDPNVVAHLEWIGFVRPIGLVVSAPALVRAGAILDRRDAEGQRLLRSVTADTESDAEDGPVPHVPDFRSFAETVLGWSFSAKGYAGTEASPIPDELEVTLTDYEETLRPDFAVRELEPSEGELPWQLLVRVLEPGTDFDKVSRGTGQLEASVHGRMERLLRQTGVPAGLLFNGRVIRLVSAPRGESSGWFDLRIEDMVQTAGRPICSAMRLLLSQTRLLALPREKRLGALLLESRKFQNEVSERLAEQVLHALYELLRGFQAAHDQSKGALLRDVLAEHPDQVYRGLLTVLLRLVFLLYAEERDMLPEDETFLQYYSVAGLHERLREDAALNPDTMNQRYGAWAQLLALFRVVFDGARWGAQSLPKRHGVLFDPHRFPFLEGRSGVGSRQGHRALAPPLVPDGTLFRALENLMVLDGERISYRALDVEQIGSVYETMMGFRLETATGRSVAVKATKPHGAPTVIDLDALLEQEPSTREAWLQEKADRKLPGSVSRSLREAESLEDLHIAVEKITALAATPDLVPPGAMILQPSAERRKSGSHYTPRQLTEPIVRTTLEPVLARLREKAGGAPTPEQILNLKVCDPAMGSGAFLVEVCRQLGEALVSAWKFHDRAPPVPADEDELIFARRMIAQRCLYGVDRNQVAVDLAKVSIWLVTLAKEHPFTFVDHALRHGDSLVGLSLSEIERFHWDSRTAGSQLEFETVHVQDRLASFAESRRQIREADDSVPDENTEQTWADAEQVLAEVSLIGDLVVAAFFEGGDEATREGARRKYATDVISGDHWRHLEAVTEWRTADPPLAPFHWELEFPEVFEDDRGGFDALVGNPPWVSFSGRQAVDIWKPYLAWLERRFATFSGWPALHSCFLERVVHATRDGGAIGVLLPAAVADLDGYGKCRALVRLNGVPREPMTYFGEDSFVGVLQPCFALSAEIARPGVLSKDQGDGAARAAFILRLPRSEDAGGPTSGHEPHPDREWASSILERLRARPKPKKGMFKDPGVHTGNCAKKLVLSDPRGACAPVREGKDISPFRLGMPRKWLALDYVAEGKEYYRIGPEERYMGVPVLLRQTAKHPIAAIHDPPAYFRNSALACLGVEGVDDRAIVCWLNSTVVAWYHVNRVRESGQKVFPQVKVKHLHDLPVPPFEPSLVSALVELHDRLAEKPQEQSLRSRVDLEVGLALGLTEVEVDRLREDLQERNL